MNTRRRRLARHRRKARKAGFVRHADDMMRAWFRRNWVKKWRSQS